MDRLRHRLIAAVKTGVRPLYVFLYIELHNNKRVISEPITVPETFKGSC